MGLHLLLAAACYAHGGVVHPETTDGLANEDIQTEPLGLSSSAAIGFSFVVMVATIIGTSLPLVFPLITKRIDQKLVQSFSFAFSAAALIFGSLYDILPEGVSGLSSISSIGNKYSHLVGLSGFLLGILTFTLLEILLSNTSFNIHCPCHGVKTCKCSEAEIFGTCNCRKASEIARMKQVSLISFLTMTIHHIPEGLAFYITVTKVIS